MSEHQANLLTIWAVSIAFPIVGIGKLYLSQVMRNNTVIRTRIGDWLVKMFIAIGLAFICIGVAYGLSLAASYQWLPAIPLWARWAIRISAVFTSLMSLVSTVIVVRHLLPLLRSPLVIDFTDER